MRKTKTITSVIIVFLICASAFSTLHADEVPEVPEILVESVEPDHERVDLAIGDNLQLIATVRPEEASNQEIFWTTDDDSISTVAEAADTD